MILNIEVVIVYENLDNCIVANKCFEFQFLPFVGMDLTISDMADSTPGMSFKIQCVLFDTVDNVILVETEELRTYDRDITEDSAFLQKNGWKLIDA